MKSRIIMCVSVLLTMVTAHANAADAVLDPDPLPIVTPFNWSGAYIGGQVGYGFGNAKFSPIGGDLRPRGFLGGIYAGYNFDVGSNVILGIDGDFSGAEINRTGVDNSDPSATASVKTDLRWSGAIRPRIGYAINRFMPYIAGGVAFGNIKDTVSLTTTATATQNSVTQQKTKTGWTIGGGVDYAATDNVILRLEYRYTDFRRRDLGAGFANATLNQKLTTNDIRLGVAYKF